MDTAAAVALLSLLSGTGKLLEPGRPPPPLGQLMLITDLGSPEVVIDGEPMGDGSNAITLRAGSHQVAVRAPSGSETLVTVEVVAGQLRTVRVSTGSPHLDLPESYELEPERHWRRPVVYSLLVASGLALTLALVEYSGGNRVASNFLNSTESAEDHLITANAALVAAPALAITAGIIWMATQPRRLPRLACAPVLGTTLGVGCAAHF